MIDGPAILHNLIAGKTAAGHSSKLLAPIAFTADKEVRAVTIAALELAARMFQGMDNGDLHFSRFAHKLLHFANRGGTLAENPNFLTRVGYAADVARTRTTLIDGNIGFAALATLGMQDEAFRARIGQQGKSLEEEIAEMAEKVRVPAAHPAWESADRLYQLYELTHPYHVWEEGIRLDNCLCRVEPSHPSTRVHGNTHPDTLWALGYWTEIANKQIALFSLRSGTARIALLGFHGTTLREFSVQFPNEPGLWEILTDVTEYFEARHGRFEIAIARPLAVEQIIIENLRLARKQRARGKLRIVKPGPAHAGSRRHLQRRNPFKGSGS
jgi:hypothetical protein